MTSQFYNSRLKIVENVDLSQLILLSYFTKLVLVSKNIKINVQDIKIPLYLSKYIHRILKIQDYKSNKNQH